jgi:hypothetical protein
MLLVTSSLYCKKASKTVKAEGMAPIINNDIHSATQKAISDALKNALGLVVGIYVSQKAYVSKSVLLQDNILSQTEGYIEKYKVLKTYKKDSFIKAKVKATVRREDLYKKIKTLKLDPKSFGNPTISFDIQEYKDAVLIDKKDNLPIKIFEKKFLDEGFIVKKSTDTDIIVKGKIESYLNKQQAYKGLVSYRANLEVSVFKTSTKEVIDSYKNTAAGIDLSSDISSKNAIKNVCLKISKNMTKDVIKYLSKKSKIRLKLNNVEDINILSELLESIRSLIEVKDAIVNKYSDKTAILDIYMSQINSHELAKRLEANLKFDINQVKKYEIEASL